MRTPLENREDVLSCKNPFLPGRLSFELAQRIIREESFFERGFKLMNGALMGWWDNSVNLHGYFKAGLRLLRVARIRVLHGGSSSSRNGSKNEETW